MLFTCLMSISHDTFDQHMPVKKTATTLKGTLKKLPVLVSQMKRQWVIGAHGNQQQLRGHLLKVNQILRFDVHTLTMQSLKYLS